MTKRALVIRLSALGDVVLTEPVLRALRSLDGIASVDLVTDRRYAKLMERSGADVVVPYDRHGADAGVGGIRRVRARLPHAEYDIVVDLQGKPRTRWLARSIPAKQRIVLRKRSWLEGVRSLLGHDPPINDRHNTEIYLSVLEPLGWTRDGFDLQAVLRRNARATPPGEVLRVGLSPGATHATKRWPETRFAALAELLSARGKVQLVLIGGPTDRALLAAIRARAPNASFDALDVTTLDVDALADLIADLDLVISVDSGPAHLAAALSTPVVVLFGPTSARRWGPIAGRHRVVSLGLSCAPCSNMGGATCPLPGATHECMVGLDEGTVMAAAAQMLESRA